MHSAEIFNKTKGIIFSTLNNKNPSEAYKMLDNYRTKIGNTLWCGLKAELDFYVNYKNDMLLDPTFDYGIKCDFTGNIDGINNCRIDVTTNLDFKKLEDYEAIQDKDNRKYKIVVMDKDSGKIADIVDLNFPIDPDNKGRLFDIAVFRPSDSNDGELKFNPYQDIITINSNDLEDFKLISTETEYYIEDFKYYSSSIPHEISPEKYYEQIENHAVNSAKLLSKTTGKNIVACCQSHNEIYGQNGEEDWVTKVYWKHPIISNYLGDIIEFEY